MAQLDIKGITKRFGGLVAINAFDLQIEKGQIIGLIGPNGAGKTTIFRVISGFYHPDEGQVVFNQDDISKLRPDEICKLGLTSTFQTTRPFAEITVLENVMIGAYNRTGNTTEAREKSQIILEFLGMSRLENQLAGGLTVPWRKRLEVARALATEPEILLLDEVMAGLRPTETDEMIELVRRISKEKGISILLVEHVMKVIMSLAERIAVLHHGVKIAEDAPDAIVKNQVVIDAYLGEEVAHVED